MARVLLRERVGGFVAMGKLRDSDLAANRSAELTAPAPLAGRLTRGVLLASFLAVGSACGDDRCGGDDCEPPMPPPMPDPDSGGDSCADDPSFCIAPMIPPTDSGPETGTDAEPDAMLVPPMPDPGD